MDREEIQAQASKFLWFHNYELIPGVMTNGAKPIKEEELAVLFQIPQDLRGKRVLDIGCADGYYTFLAEERGASVVAIDALPSQGFFLAHHVCGSKAEFHQMDIYDLQLDTFGAFDVVFFMGVYYHLKNPILALERVASVARELVIIESHIMDQSGSAAFTNTTSWRRVILLTGGRLTYPVCYRPCAPPAFHAPSLLPAIIKPALLSMLTRDRAPPQKC